MFCRSLPCPALSCPVHKYEAQSGHQIHPSPPQLTPHSSLPPPHQSILLQMRCTIHITIHTSNPLFTHAHTHNMDMHTHSSICTTTDMLCPRPVNQSHPIPSHTKPSSVRTQGHAYFCIPLKAPRSISHPRAGYLVPSSTTTLHGERFRPVSPSPPPAPDLV